MTRTTTEYWLALKLVTRLPIKQKCFLAESIGLKALFLLPKETLETMALTPKQIAQITNPDWCLIKGIIKKTQAIGGQLLCYGDRNYPEQLKEIYDPPLVLFTLGEQALLTQTQVAIVGSRSATHAALSFAKTLAQDLAMQHIIITSGLALGIDGAAHQGAFIDEQAKTIAVIATGLDKIYPYRHKALANQIVQQHGLIITEFLPNTPAKAGHFPRRNRLISALSLGVVVVEAELKSGSLITARCALEQNKDVFAVPGSVYNPMSKGCHWLIKQGAKLIENCADIMEELDLSFLRPDCNNQQNIEKSSTQDLFIDPLLASVDYEATAIEMIAARSNLAIDIVLTQLTILELKGLITAVPGGYLRLK